MPSSFSSALFQGFTTPAVEQDSTMLTPSPAVLKREKKRTPSIVAECPTARSGTLRTASTGKLPAEGCGPHSAHVCGVPRARSRGVTGAGIETTRLDRLGESPVEKPRGDDSLADGSIHGGTTGHSRPRVVTRPADAGRDGPEPEPERPGSHCRGKPRRERRARTSH